MRIVAISDVHTRWADIKIPPCDVLISAGDYSFRGQEYVVRGFHAWLREQPARHVISVQGNHELWVEKNFLEAKRIAQEECPGVHFIEEDMLEIEGVKFWCSAWTPEFGQWAWNAQRGNEISKHWDIIPDDIDVFVTHGPPYGVLDEVHEVRMGVERYEHVGCYDLMRAVKRVKPDLHFFGHIHQGYGQFHKDGTSFYNASICDERYWPTNLPHVVEYEK